MYAVVADFVTKEKIDRLEVYKKRSIRPMVALATKMHPAWMGWFIRHICSAATPRIPWL